MRIRTAYVTNHLVPGAVYGENVFFSTFERFDSARAELIRGSCHLFVKRCLQLVRKPAKVCNGHVLLVVQPPHCSAALRFTVTTAAGSPEWAGSPFSDSSDLAA